MPSDEALAAARELVPDKCLCFMLDGIDNCGWCERREATALALDAFAEERVRAAVVLVLRELYHGYERWDAVEHYAERLDRLAGREVGTLLKEVRES